MRRARKEKVIPVGMAFFFGYDSMLCGYHLCVMETDEGWIEANLRIKETLSTTPLGLLKVLCGSNPSIGKLNCPQKMADLQKIGKLPKMINAEKELTYFLFK